MSGLRLVLYSSRELCVPACPPGVMYMYGRPTVAAAAAANNSDDDGCAVCHWHYSISFSCNNNNNK